MATLLEGGLSRRDVSNRLASNGLFYNPVEQLIVDPYWEGYDTREILVRRLSLDGLKSLIESAAGKREVYLDELIGDCEVVFSASDDRASEQHFFNELVARIANDPCWIEAGGPYDKLVAYCESIIERYESKPGRASSAARSELRDKSLVGHAIQSDISRYLEAALDEYRTKSGWKGLDAETAIETFLHFVSSGECTVTPPEPGHLRLRTPDGDLVALIVDNGDYRSICIDLEQAGGRSGTVCEAEWVNLADMGNRIEFIPNEVGGLTPVDTGEPVYGSSFHTNVYNGNDDDCTVQVDFDVDGSETYYPSRSSADHSYGQSLQNEPLDSQTVNAKLASHPPMGKGTKAVPER